MSSFVHYFKVISELKLELQSRNTQFGRKLIFFVPCDLAIWQMTSKNNRASLPWYFKLCLSFYSHRSIQTGVTVRNHPNVIKIDDFLSRASLKFDRWPRKTIGHFFYGTSSFVYNFLAVDQFKLELQSRITQMWSKSMIFCLVWAWNLTDDLEKQWGNSSMLLQALCIISSPSVHSNWCYSPETPNVEQNRWFLVLCDLEIWQMTFENNRVPLLCCFKLCASFHSHLWIQTGVIVQKHPIWVNIGEFLSRVTLIFDWWPWKTIEHFS